MATQPYQLALERQEQPDQSAMMTEARKALARQQAAGYPMTPIAVQGMQTPTPQMRNSAGQMGPALYAQDRMGSNLEGSRSEGSPFLQYAGGINTQLGGLQGGTKPPTGSSLGQQPTTGPVTPGQPSNGGTDFGALNQQISGFGPAPTLDEATMAKIRAQESQRLMNIERASLNELGAAAASSGALLGGDVRSLAAGFASDRMAAESKLGTDLAVQKLNMDREDYARKFGLAGQLAMQRETQGFSAQEAELDRRWRSGERLSDQEWQTLERARDRAQQTSERLGSQAFTSEEQQKQRSFVGDQNAQDRLTQVALAEKQIAATRANLETQLAQARSENNLDRIQQLTVQMNDLDQQDQQLRQQNDQFLSSIGLDRQRFEEASRQFDLTRGDQVGQFAQNLDLQNRQLSQQGTQFSQQLLQNLDISRMDDQTRRYVAELQDRYARDLNASTIDPTTLQTILSAAGSLAPILQGLGISGGDIARGIGGLFGGGSPTTGTPFTGGTGTGPFGAGGPTAGGASSGISGLASGAIGVGGAAAGAALIAKAFEPGSGGGWDATAGQFIAGPIGAAFGAIVGFGKDGRQVAQDKFTAEFDNAYRQLESQGALNKPPSDPTSFWNPQQKMGAALAFQASVRQAALQGPGKVEISEPDWQRMERLGLAASVQGSDRARHYAIDDPRLIAMMGKGPASQFFTFEYPGQNNDKLFADTQGSTSALIASNSLIVRDKVTGEPIDFNNRAQMEAIAARNAGSSVGPTGMGTPPPTTPPKQDYSGYYVPPGFTGSAPETSRSNYTTSPVGGF